MHTLTHNVFFFLKLQTVLFFFSLLSNQWQKLHFVRNDHQYAHQLGAIVSISLVNQTVFLSLPPPTLVGSAKNGLVHETMFQCAVRPIVVYCVYSVTTS